MEKVTDVKVSKVTESKYVKPLRMYYKQNGKEKNRDIMDAKDSVAIMIFNVTSRKLILVKQFRPVVYFYSVDNSDRKDKINTDKYPPSLGVTLELCAGIVDKNKTVEEIASEEVLEECGYEVKPNELEKIVSFRSHVGVNGSVTTIFYCEVSDDKKVAAGGGIDNELIEIVEVPVEEIEKLMTEPQSQPSPSPPAFFFALTWFLHNKAGQYLKTM